MTADVISATAHAKKVAHEPLEDCTFLLIRYTQAYDMVANALHGVGACNPEEYLRQIRLLLACLATTEIDAEDARNHQRRLKNEVVDARRTIHNLELRLARQRRPKKPASVTKKVVKPKRRSK